MLNKVYRLVQPRRFELVFQDIPLDTSHVIVRPTHLSICNADQRYYQGTRSEQALRRKLPMALIHEGMGAVVADPTGRFRPGEQVVMIPNLPAEKSDFAAENYLTSSRFCGSGTDGFLQEYVSCVPDRLIRLPEGMNPQVGAFTEFVSVGRHAIGRLWAFSHGRREEIGVWGDGNLGYVVSLLLKMMFPEVRVTVVGVNPMKLAYFSFADDCFPAGELPEDFAPDHAFECVGGSAAAGAVNQIIDHIRPEGSISLLGVSEDPAPLNTRMILEKGLRLFGSSRSGRKDFEEVMELYRRHPETVEYLENLVGQVLRIRGIQDIAAAFDADIHKLMGKTVMLWDE